MEYKARYDNYVNGLHNIKKLQFMDHTRARAHTHTQKGFSGQKNKIVIKDFTNPTWSMGSIEHACK